MRGVLLLLLCSPGFAGEKRVIYDTFSELRTAANHRSQFAGREAYQTYLTVAPVAEDKRGDLINAIKFAVASSSKQQILEYCTPQKVSDTLYHLDLDRLGWNVYDWIRVLKRYPYYHGNSYPLVVRADWLLIQLMDSDESPAHWELLYGSKTIPKTVKELRAFWRVDNSLGTRHGVLEGNSGVSVQKVRVLESRSIPRGYWWETRDVLELKPGADPLEALDNNFKIDGQEIIVGYPKVSLKKGTRGVLQFYALAAGDGKLVFQAPTDLVEDHNRFRGLAAIRTAGSCVGCHTSGLLLPNRYELKELIKSGVDIYAKDKKKQEQVELYHLGEVEGEIKYANELYAKGIQGANHLGPQENAEAFKRAVDEYDRTLTLEDVAREHYIEPKELRLALAYYGALPARLASLAHGKRINRPTAERLWYTLRQVVQRWESKEVELKGIEDIKRRVIRAK